MEESKIKYVLLLPLQYNDGRHVPQQILDGMLDEIFVLAGGYSIAGTVKGAYRMKDGTKQEDESWQVWIGVREEEIPDLEKMVAKFGKELGQEMMYLERTGGTINFIPPLLL
jgi:hypothetical protein